VGEDREEAVCYLCLDCDLDDDSKPLRRDCACRGTDAGFVHLSCLANYAATKSKQASGSIEFSNLGLYVPAVIKNIKTSSRLILPLSLSCSSEGSIHTIQ
jgi:hypothetical protein